MLRGLLLALSSSRRFGVLSYTLFAFIEHKSSSGPSGLESNGPWGSGFKVSNCPRHQTRGRERGCTSKKGGEGVRTGYLRFFSWCCYALFIPFIFSIFIFLLFFMPIFFLIVVPLFLLDCLFLFVVFSSSLSVDWVMIFVSWLGNPWGRSGSVALLLWVF